MRGDVSARCRYSVLLSQPGEDSPAANSSSRTTPPHAITAQSGPLRHGDAVIFAVTTAGKRRARICKRKTAPRRQPPSANATAIRSA